MRRKRKKTVSYSIDRRLLFGAVIFLVLGFATVNCNIMPGGYLAGDHAVTAALKDDAAETDLESAEPQTGPQAEAGETETLDDKMWADAPGVPGEPRPRPTNDTPDYISLDVRDADLRDVFSLIAYKLDANIIYLEEPTTITIKTSELSPITTLQTVLQKEGLDYLTVGRNYIVGERGRLYEDFANRMYLSRFNLFYVSPEVMEGFISELNVPVESLTVGPNQQSLWMQGTPMALGKAREVINSLDVIENAAFAEGGSRHIRMPVSIATGNMAQDELHKLIDFLSILLDGFRDERTDLGWGTWDHPGPVPRIHMDWSSPVIKPHDIKMKITPDLDPNPGSYLHYLVAEGTPDNIDLVNQMIEEIRGTPGSPLHFEGDPDIPEVPVFPDPNDNNDNDINDNDNDIDNNDNNNEVDNQGQGGETGRSSNPTRAYHVSLNAVPTAGGSLSGGGSYLSGASVSVTAVPNEGYKFIRWIENGAELSTSRSYTFTIYDNRNLEAVFSKTAANEETGKNEKDEAEENDSFAAGEDN